MFKKNLLTKTFIYYFISVIILSFITLIIFFFIKNKQNVIPYYTIYSSNQNNITAFFTINELMKFDQKRLLMGTKKDLFFTAISNNLGIVAVAFDTNNRSIDNKIIFRIKQANSKDWYYQNTYKTDQIQQDFPFPFGFPIIRNSKNIKYHVQIESLDGKPSESLIFDGIIYTKYKYSKEEFLKNPSILFVFATTKLTSYFKILSVTDILYLLIFFLLLFFIFLLIEGLIKKIVKIPKNFSVKVTLTLLIKNRRMKLIIRNESG